MRAFWMFLPPWLYAVVITFLGRWGESRWSARDESGGRNAARERVWRAAGSVIVTNLFFLSLLPTTLLVWSRGMLPLEGARAGLGIGLIAFVLGCVPARLLDVAYTGWDRTLWRLLVDLVRVGGALMMIGWLVAL